MLSAKLNSSSLIPAAMVKIAPSILSADYANLRRSIELAELGGADMFHVDVMDGHFVPNITIGPVVIAAVRRLTKRPLDVHLMIHHPDKLIKVFCDAGADDITVHVEAKHSPAETIAMIKDNHKKPGIVLNPSTPFQKAKPFMDEVGMLLIMTVKPGFPGQRFMPEVLPKITAAREYIKKKGLAVEIEVDGGIDANTAHKVVAAGADILVAGSAIFGGNIVKRMTAIRDAAEGQGI